MITSLDINATFRGGGRSVEFLDQINQASIVMLAETGIVPREVAVRIARGIAQVIENERTGKDGMTPRSSADYLDLRTATDRRRRAGSLAAAHRPQPAGSRLDHCADEPARRPAADHRRTHQCARITAQARRRTHRDHHPAYTHGVQAQPTTFAHYLLAFESALARATERLQQTYARVNRCPLGAAALAHLQLCARPQPPRRTAGF